MHYLTSVLAILILVGAARADDSDKPWQIHGQVVDEQGMPVEDFEAATFWISNGNWWDEKGELLKEAAAGKLWKNEGVLAARPNGIATRLPEEKFSLKIESEPRIAVFAVDKLHEYGGIVLVERSQADKPITVTMAPLARVTAEVYCSEAGRTPDWSCAAVYVPDSKGNQTKLMVCGSFRGQISLLLPPGIYHLDVYSESPNGSIRSPKEPAGEDATACSPVHRIRVEVPRDKTTLDLGVLNVVLPRDNDGIAHDYSQFYGKEPPELEITDARGVPKGVKLADFHGKWVLLDFWAAWCGPCVHGSLPKLTTFCEEHAADRDRFEILAICNTEKEEARTIEAFEGLEAPLVEKVWAGKQLPFPVLVDGEGRTSDVYGISHWPTVLLIDPEGHLVKLGNEATLAEKLKEKKP
ncbi:MAG: TlpA family protein disulfide reductase [Planctomycetes bacterium]|nr:TlpA family protein disulfide reductase [Planctomycetota bacterium]